ncbi:MAG TPA: hypothetical protein VGH85_19975 [Mycobacteriales bacterium]|jgi:hypothetical protein
MIFLLAMAILAFCFLCFVAFLYLVWREGATGMSLEGVRDPAVDPGLQLTPLDQRAVSPSGPT